MTLPHEDRRLLTLLDDGLARAGRRAGERLACRQGCTECCIGPFPITALDVLRLREGLDVLSRRDPRRADALRERARRAWSSLSGDFPGDVETGWLTADERTEQRYLDRHREAPCPALDPDTGACDLYAWRPVTCRTYGPPVRVRGEDLPPCRLCFARASDAEIDACRVTFDPADLEGSLLAGLEDDAGRETLVAFALDDAT